MGDELKQDQFRFFYDTCRIIYCSALRKRIINDDEHIEQNIIPKLVAFKSALVIRDIKKRKKMDGIHDAEKKERLS